VKGLFFPSRSYEGKEGKKIDHDQIIRRAAAGDEAAFRFLVEEYKSLVYSICFNAVRDYFEAENLTQETFLQVYKSLPQYAFQGFRTWIARIALHKAIDYRRSAAYKLREATVPLSEIERLQAENKEVQEILLEAEEKNLLAECLKRVPGHYEKIIRKNIQENKSCKQIALEENMNVRTVETRLYRGKQLLRKTYEELSKT